VAGKSKRLARASKTCCRRYPICLAGTASGAEHQGSDSKQTSHRSVSFRPKQVAPPIAAISMRGRNSQDVNRRSGIELK
jgi:hypothetical protein